MPNPSGIRSKYNRPASKQPMRYMSVRTWFAGLSWESCRHNLIAGCSGVEAHPPFAPGWKTGQVWKRILPSRLAGKPGIMEPGLASSSKRLFLGAAISGRTNQP